MAKHKKYSRKRRGQKRRNKTRSIKSRGGSDDEQYRYESPPPPLNINDLNDTPDTINDIPDSNNSSQETVGYVPNNNFQDFSQDNFDPLTSSQLATSGLQKRTYDVSFESQDPAEPKRSKIDTKEILRYGDESNSDEEEKSDDEQDAYQSDNEYEFSDNELGGGRKRKRRKTNKRKSFNSSGGRAKQARACRNSRSPEARTRRSQPAPRAIAGRLEHRRVPRHVDALDSLLLPPGRQAQRAPA